MVKVNVLVKVNPSRSRLQLRLGSGLKFGIRLLTAEHFVARRIVCLANSLRTTGRSDMTPHEAVSSWPPPMGFFGNLGDVWVLYYLVPNVRSGALVHADDVEVWQAIQLSPVSKPARILEVVQKSSGNFLEQLKEYSVEMKWN